MSVEKLIKKLAADPAPSAVQSLVAVVDWLRPGLGDDIETVETRMALLQVTLESDPEFHEVLASRLRDWLSGSRYFQLLSGLGLYSRRGFFKEFGERVYDRINPAPADMDNIRDAFFLIFRKKIDSDWVPRVSDEAWLILLRVLWRFSHEELEKARLKAVSEILNAVEMLSVWVAAEELEPNLLRLDPRIIQKDSAFVAQQRELSRFVEHYARWLNGDEDAYLDDAHARVLLEQCAAEIARLRRRAVVHGTSIALAHLLERLDQTLVRIEHLLDIIIPGDAEQRLRRSVGLFKELVQANVARHSLRTLWQQNLKLLSRSVTENASDHGEHYIARSRGEYGRMLLSGLGGGLVIALMALIKMQVLEQGFSEGRETLLVSLNYGLGFMLIHMLGFTVATKQPAMTASSIAEQVERGEQGRANARKLAALLIEVSRTQLIAIVGNVVAALSLAVGLAWAFQYYTGTSLIPDSRAEYAAAGMHAWHSLALVYAAVAGVWLFVSGLVSGFFDNRAALIGLSARLRVHPLLRWLPLSWREKLGEYLDENYGALIGNFVFGVLLGSTAYLGSQIGVSVDIRHVAFSSADLGYVTVVSGLGWQIFAMLLGSVLAIGLVNLLVSFSLALNVALRSRGARISSLSRLLKALWQQIRQQPLALFYPPAMEKQEEDTRPPEKKPAQPEDSSTGE